MEQEHSSHCGCLAHNLSALSRRRFLTLSAGAGGLALAGSMLPFSSARANGSAEALLLTCMDYRLTHAVVDYMDGRQMTREYDHVVLAGASLGAVTHKFPDWGRTFWEHLDVAVKLHHVKKVIALDHRDCGAYKIVFGKDTKGDEERELHARELKRLRAALRKKHRELEFESLLMSLDGSVESISL